MPWGMQTSGNKVLVTGGAVGIGFGLAERFVKEGNQVLICGRRESALAEAAAKLPGIGTFACDLATPSGREALHRWVAEHHPDTSVLVNNAGIQNWMHVTDADFMARAAQELAVNVEAPLHLTQLFWNHAALRTIVNVTSGLCFVPLAKVAVYSATKAFFHSFTLSLRELCKSRGVEVVELIPPALNTDLGGKGIHDFAPPVAGFIDAVFEQLAQGKTTCTYLTTEALSQAGQDVFGAALARLFWSDRWSRVLAFAAAMSIAEWLRGHLFTGFPWNAIGYALTPVPVMMQSAALIGVWGLTLAACFIFAAPALLVSEAGPDRRAGRIAVLAAGALVLAHLGFCNGSRFTEAYHQGGCQRAGTETAFLSATRYKRFEANARAAAHIQRPHAFGSVDLMAGDGHKVDIHRFHIERDLTESLRAIRMEEYITLAADLTDFRQRLDDADLIIHAHYRDKQCIFLDGRLQHFHV